MAERVPRVYGAATSVYFELYGPTGEALENGVSFAAGDVTVTIDGGTETNVATLPSLVSGSSFLYQQPLTSGELTGAVIALKFSDQTVPQAWLDHVIIIETTGDPSAQFPDSFSAIAQAVLDESRVGHNTPNTLGAQMRYSVGVAESAGTAGNTLELEAGQVTEDDEFNECYVKIIGGAGIGQLRAIQDTVLADNEIVVAGGNWSPAIDNTSIYLIASN